MPRRLGEKFSENEIVESEEESKTSLSSNERSNSYEEDLGATAAASKKKQL